MTTTAHISQILLDTITHISADLAQVGRAAATGDMGANSNFRVARTGAAVLREAPIRATAQVAVSEARCEVPATHV
jgi:hypothetical protein